uniref:Uncharacterized protein n=1 Tax=Schistocephalus solidus TaxID=70667 RepID=A0A0X3NXT6_SCHSO
MPVDDHFSTQLTVHSLRWRTDLDFDLPVRNLQLLFQPCLLGDQAYTVQVYQHSPLHKQREDFGVPICQLEVNNGHNVQLCSSILPGSYKIRVSDNSSLNTSINASSSPSSTVAFFAGQRIGRVFFVPPDLNPLVLRPLHAIIEPLVSHIVEDVPKNILIVEKNGSNERKDRTDKSDPCRAYRSLVEVSQGSRAGPAQMPEGLFFNVSCQSQRLSLILAVHSEEQRLWIYTLPVPKTTTPTQRSKIFRELQQKVGFAGKPRTCIMNSHKMCG